MSERTVELLELQTSIVKTFVEKKLSKNEVKLMLDSISLQYGIVLTPIHPVDRVPVRMKVSNSKARKAANPPKKTAPWANVKEVTDAHAALGKAEKALKAERTARKLKKEDKLDPGLEVVKGYHDAVANFVRAKKKHGFLKDEDSEKRRHREGADILLLDQPPQKVQKGPEQDPEVLREAV